MTTIDVIPGPATIPRAIATRAHLIPEFPTLTPISLAHRADIVNFTSEFDPYSDFNFTSMWSWDTEGEVRVAWCNGNLVVRFTDYIDRSSFLSVLGHRSIPATVRTLLNFAPEIECKPELRLVPETVVKSLGSSDFRIEADQDNHDYVLSVPGMATLSGGSSARKSRLVSCTRRRLGSRLHVATLDLTDPHIAAMIVGFISTWGEIRGKDPQSVEPELIATGRLLNSPLARNLFSVGAFLDGRFAGFQINEAVGSTWSIGHFAKADTRVKGLTEVLDQEGARQLRVRGVEFLNIEQDLGIQGLRQHKMGHHPISFLRKYTVGHG